MAVIPELQLLLMRKQREFQQLMDACDWQGLVALEKELIGLLDKAITDPQRSTGDLLKQMGILTGLYRELSTICHFRQKQFNQ